LDLRNQYGVLSKFDGINIQRIPLNDANHGLIKGMLTICEFTFAGRGLLLEKWDLEAFGGSG